MTLFIEQVLNGLQFGLLLFLLAAGLTLVFGIMDLVNLAHGSLYMMGAYFAATFVAWTGNFLLGAALALGATLAQAGEMNTALAIPSLVALAASLVGMRLGQLVRGMVRSETFRLCFFLGLFVLGAHLALRGLL